jgi:hypothetical protein
MKSLGWLYLYHTTPDRKKIMEKKFPIPNVNKNEWHMGVFGPVNNSFPVLPI